MINYQLTLILRLLSQLDLLDLWLFFYKLKVIVLSYVSHSWRFQVMVIINLLSIVNIIKFQIIILLCCKHGFNMLIKILNFYACNS